MMKTAVKLSMTALALASALTSVSASADVTSNVGLFSQYLYRGLAQTAGNPALQGGFDYSHESGLYAGVWGSNINWFDDYGAANGAYASTASLELDLYAGFKGSAATLGYDLGVLQYYYPGSIPASVVKPDTLEVYGALSRDWLTAKVSYVVSSGLFGVDQARGSYYLDLSAAFPIAEGLTLNAHVGNQKFAGTAVAGGPTNDELFSYVDYRLGLTKDLGEGWSATGYYSSTDAKDAGYKSAANKGENLGKGTFVVGLSRSM